MYCILIVGAERSLLQILGSVYESADVRVLSAATAAEGREVALRQHPDLVLFDSDVCDERGLTTWVAIHKEDPALPIVLLTTDGSSETAIEAIKLGAFDYVRKPVDSLTMRDVITRALNIRRSMHVPTREAETVVNETNERVEVAVEGFGLVGDCPAMQDVYKAIGRVASQNVNVLICGESGTGKELVAQAIHRHSLRSGGKFLAVNCAAIPEPLLESELFGHEKGAFTGAQNRRIGKFEQCSGGTLFLDEVGDMTPLTQSKVLRALQEKRFERVGGNETVEIEVRIIAATNRNLDRMLLEGHFRTDLFYRLNGFSINLPPLRERPEDIPLLVTHFLAIFNRELGKDIGEILPETMDLLIHYPWPGNIRELQSVLRQALLHATGAVLLPDFLPPAVARGTPRHAALLSEALRSPVFDAFVEQRLHAGSDDLYAESLALMERFVLTRVLRHTAGNQSRAAKILGITRGSLRSKIRMQGITINQTVQVEDQPSAEREAASPEETPFSFSPCG